MEKLILSSVNTTLYELKSLYSFYYNYIPGSSVVIRYIKNSYQNDPVRIVLELFLIIFALKYLLSKKYKPDASEVVLSTKEVDELVDEWQPESLAPAITDKQRKILNNIPIVKGPMGPKVTLDNGQRVLNLASFDFLALCAKQSTHKVAISALRKHGVGACGPPGFYGTLDCHLDLEKKLAEFIGTEDAIIYAQAFSAVSSVIPAFSKRGDIIVYDEGINFALQKGLQISRSQTCPFKHNDMISLDKVLADVVEKNEGKPLNRRFIVVEGLYQNTGDIVHLKRLIELKYKYKFRIIIDETLSFGVLGKRGAGVADHFDVDVNELDIIVSSMAHTLASGGGFCAGSKEIVDHQRLSSAAYCFSAALPSMLAVSAIEGIKQIEQNPSQLIKLKENIKTFRNAFGSTTYVTLVGDENSPVMHLYANVPESKQEEMLDLIVDECLVNGLLLTRARYVDKQELKKHRPSIRLAISAGHVTTELEKAAKMISNISRIIIANK